MKNPYIIPAAMICAAILAGFWMLKPSSEPQSEPQKVVTVQPPDILIWDAAEKGNIEAVKQHLAEGVDVNAKDELIGRTPLHLSAMGGQNVIAELLIAKGADVNAKNDFGYTPLDVAKRHPETADLLRKHGGKTGEELKAEQK